MLPGEESEHTSGGFHGAKMSKEDCRHVLSRGCIILNEYMDPVPVVDIMQQEEFLKYSECRDIYEIQFTTEKNRAVIDKVRRKGGDGYISFKRFLTMSNQTILVEYLERVENDMETVSLIKALRKRKGITNRWKGVKNDIIELYQDYYVKTELSPLMLGFQIHVDNLFVPLEMEELSTSQNSEDFLKDTFSSLGWQKNTRKKVNSLRDMLFEDDQLLNTVFVIADPGVGKTTFCRKLISLWCNTHTGRMHVQKDTAMATNADSNENATNVQQKEADSEIALERQNAETLNLFDFLFFVSLRHTSDEVMIEDMIANQLQIDKDRVNSILGSSDLKCLIILDGLDEWSAPDKTKYHPYEIKGFPKSDHLDKCHILATTRPWKLLSISHVMTHAHKEIYITGMKSDNSDKLIRLFLIQLHKIKTPDLTLQKFKNEIQVKGLRNLSATPLILKLLLCLWLENGQLKTSVCHIYGAVIELLIEYGLKRNEENETFTRTFDQVSSSTKFASEFFQNSEFNNINRFADILLQLAKLSFDAQFSEKQNTKLIFRDLDLKPYDLELELCSKLGILSQRPIIGKSLLYRERTVAFLHKSFQEFYAAMYISQKPKECMQRIKEIGNTPEKIFEFSKVFQFVGEVCPNIIEDIFQYIRLTGDGLDNRDAETEQIRAKCSELMLSIAKDSHSTNLLIRMNYLIVSENIYSQLLDNICTQELREIDLIKMDVSHTQITRLLTCSPYLTTVRLSNTKCYADKLCKCLLENNEMPNTTSNVSPAKIFTAVMDSKIFTHMPRFPNLQKMYLHNLTLTHTQIEYLFNDSPFLTFAEMRSVACIEDNSCGCQASVQRTANRWSMSRIFRCLASESRDSSPVVAVGTSIETLKISYGDCGMFNHINRYLRLQDITLMSIQLSHTHIFNLLTGSEDLTKIKLKDIIGTADKMCECIPSNRKYASKHVTSSMKYCTIELGSETLKHIQGYPRLQELNIVSIKLTHTEITTLMSTSPHLNKVRLSQVTCNPEKECGCLSAGFAQKKNFADVAMDKKISLVHKCTILSVSGVFDHVQAFPELQELIIEATDLTHTEVTCLLTTSPNLKNVRLHGVFCTADDECGCPSDFRLSLFTAEICTFEGGNEMFSHVGKCPKLKELKVHYVEVSYSKLIDLLTQSPCLRELSLAGLEYVTDVEYDGIHSSPDNTNFDQFLQDRILRVLRRLPKIDGLLIKLEDIEINPESIVNEAIQIEHIEYMNCIESGGFRDSNVETDIPIRRTILLKVKVHDLT